LTCDSLQLSVPLWLPQFADCSHCPTWPEVMSEQLAAFWHTALIVWVQVSCALGSGEEQLASAAIRKRMRTGFIV
jgi:hypothetical protein